EVAHRPARLLREPREERAHGAVQDLVRRDPAERLLEPDRARPHADRGASARAPPLRQRRRDVPRPLERAEEDALLFRDGCDEGHDEWMIKLLGRWPCIAKKGRSRSASSCPPSSERTTRATTTASRGSSASGARCSRASYARSSMRCAR